MLVSRKVYNDNTTVIAKSQYIRFYSFYCFFVYLQGCFRYGNSEYIPNEQPVSVAGARNVWG